MVAPPAPDAGPDAVLRSQFDDAITKLVVAQADQLRILHKLQDDVCAQVSIGNKTNTSPPSEPGLHAMIDELFARDEVQRGLVEWLGEEEACIRAQTLVGELQVDIKTGEGNDARTTVNKLLPLYMEALNIRELGGHAAPAASPGGKNGDKKLLGSLVLGSLNPFLEQLRMMYSDAVSDGESYLAGKGEDFKETTKRLKAGLFVFLNTGNYASHNRGKLSFCQQVELCGAVGAMAETLPVVFEACQVVKGIRTSKRSGKTSPTKGGSVGSGNEVAELPMEIKIGEERGMFIAPYCTPSQGSDATSLSENVLSEWTSPGRIAEDSIMGTLQQINLPAYYRSYLVDSSRAKYEDTLTHMEMVPKARLCVKGTSCNRDNCAESHSILEALPFNPLVVTLQCPVPDCFWHDFVHENDLCLFYHGELKVTPAFRKIKKVLCWDGADCKNAGCLRSHSLAEVCWFNPSFRTEDCVQGKDCQYNQNCCAFHKEYQQTKRSVDRNEYVGVAEPILFLPRTLKALKKVSLPSPSKPKSVPKTGPLPRRAHYHKNQTDEIPASSSDQKKYTRVLSHMQAVPKARMCMNSEHYKEDSANLCDEAHNLTEALSFNPLAMVLPCRTPVSCRDDFIHTNGLCVFYHGEKPVPKEFLKTKNLLCELLENCEDETCTKSHSIVEICWFFPIFHVNKCPQGDSCKRMETCSLYHSEHHEKRDSTMNNTVGKTEPVLFILRAYSELVFKTQNNHEDVDNGSVKSCEPSEPPFVDAAEVTDDSDSYTLSFDEALNKGSDAERVKYERVLAHMELVPKARLCTKSENHDGVSALETCVESHSRLEALEFNPLAMILKCPITSGEGHRQSLCVFDHNKGSIPKGFLKEKKLLCEDFDACGNANCVKSHSFAEVCWFNPQFRVADCPQGSECPRKQTCVGFHSEHFGRRNARTNSQVGSTERALFVERVYEALVKRRAQALSRAHPILVEELTPETSQEDEADEMLCATENTPEAGHEDDLEPNCKLS
ncbi:hypothetical protein PC129_g14445 [Phytophthora cactorum]|uniref:Uncharacterized protein n=1 Tax=Phytophthora cactorum TaxID=29920 RepID=A0A329SBP0_9STRA|nr:hypothetical protein Pcac1_g15733 [Phytophthora cactorum]KAG2811971.1 hypothetical protein PC111_g15006 [Phytophthora cactorum]KAG2820494.1 hypothetical protein PC112_g11756 [Phytophthora cactorum]KAG2851224.1 hypothetical protein PC113_g16097 [Phytophthora cactorum]KAG2890041.1 hypothetical protein PC114_g17677 [Phytophthora cactorum]